MKRRCLPGLKLEEKLTAAAHCALTDWKSALMKVMSGWSVWDWSEQQQREFRNLLLRNLGVPIRTMCLSAHRKYSFFGAGGDAPKSLDIMKKAVDFGANIDIRYLSDTSQCYDVYLLYEESTEQTRRDSGKSNRAVEYAAGNGMILAFETMETPFMDTVEKAMYYVDKVKSPWLGVYPDAGNLQNAAVCCTAGT